MSSDGTVGLERWLTRGHLVHQGAAGMVRALTLAVVLEVGAAIGLSYVAGFAAVGEVLKRFSALWLAVVGGAFVVSFVGYVLAYHGVYGVEEGPRLTKTQLVAVVLGGFGGFLSYAGSALDTYALRAAGADKRDARVRVAALAGMEQGVLAILGTAAAIIVLVRGLPAPPHDFTLPWAVLPVPGFVIAFWAGERYRSRLHGGGWRGALRTFLDAIHLNRELFLRPQKHGAAVLGMAIFWLADAFAVGAALAAFGFVMNPAALFVGFATGMIFTRRTGPLGGAGLLMLILPVTLWHSGAPMATAVVAVFTCRILAFWSPLPFALAGLPTLRRMRPPEASDAPRMPASETA